MSAAKQSSPVKKKGTRKATGPRTSYDTGRKKVKVDVEHDCTGQTIISVTKDRIELCLERNLDLIGKKAWLAPLSVFLTLLGVVSTAEDYKSFWGLNADEVSAIFKIALVISACWLIRSAFICACTKKSKYQVIEKIWNDLTNHT